MDAHHPMPMIGNMGEEEEEWGLGAENHNFVLAEFLALISGGLSRCNGSRRGRQKDRKSPKMVVLLSVKYQNCSGRFLFAHGVLVHQLKKTKRELLCKLSLFISRGEIHFNPSPIWPLLGLCFPLYLWDIVHVLRYGYYDNFMDTQTVCAKCTREMERKSQKARHFKCAAFYILLRKSPKCGASWLIGSCGFSSALLLLGNHPVQHCNNWP